MPTSEFYCDQCHTTFFASVSPEDATVICLECGHSHLIEAAFQGETIDVGQSASPKYSATDWAGIIGLLLFGLAMTVLCAFGTYLILSHSDDPGAAQPLAKTSKRKGSHFAIGVPQLSLQVRQRALVADGVGSMDTAWAPEQVCFYKASIETEEGSTQRNYEMICRLKTKAKAGFDIEKGDWYGTAIVLSPDGHLLVRAGSVLNARDFVVRINGERFRPELLCYDRTHDLAIVKIDATDLTACRFADFAKTVDQKGVSIAGYASDRIFSKPKQVRVSVGATDSPTKDFLQRTILEATVEESFDSAPILNADRQICGITAISPGIPGTQFTPRWQTLSGLEALLKHASVQLPEGRSASLKSDNDVPFLVPYLVSDRYRGPDVAIQFDSAVKATPNGTNFNTSPEKTQTSQGSFTTSPAGRLSVNSFHGKDFDIPFPIQSTLIAAPDDSGSVHWTTEELLRETPPPTGFFPSRPRIKFNNRAMQNLYDRNQPRPQKKPDRFFRDQTICERTSINDETVTFQWAYQRQPLLTKRDLPPTLQATGRIVYNRQLKAAQKIEKMYRILFPITGRTKRTVTVSATSLTEEQAARWNTDFPDRPATTNRISSPSK